MPIFYLLRLVFNFITSSLFKEGELNINKPEFNPIKVIAIITLVVYVFGSIFIIYRMTNLYIEVEERCPNLIRRVIDGGENDYPCHPDSIE